jgi:hypothetical protein
MLLKSTSIIAGVPFAEFAISEIANAERPSPPPYTTTTQQGSMYIRIERTGANRWKNSIGHSRAI